jgi:hypothetical protein
VPHIQLVNPDFFLEGSNKKHGENLLAWLKVRLSTPSCSQINSVNQEINPVPETLIRQWEDYHFLLQYEAFQHRIVVNLLLGEHKERSLESNDTDILAPSLPTIYALLSRMTGEVQAIVTAYRELLSQFPDLVCIFHAGRLLIPDLDYLVDHDANQLFQTHIVLDLSSSETFVENLTTGDCCCTTFLDFPNLGSFSLHNLCTQVWRGPLWKKNHKPYGHDIQHAEICRGQNIPAVIGRTKPSRQK